MSGGVFNQYGHEAFHAAEGGAVNHHRTVLFVVLTSIFELEAFGEVVVHLDGTELPTASEGILHHEVEFGAVECGFTIFDVCGESLFFACLDDGLLCSFPVLFGADVLFAVHLVAEGNLSLIVLELQGLEDDEDDVHDAEEFLLHLIWAAEKVGIVLRKSAYTGQTVELTALFIAVDGSELCQTQGKVLVTAGFPCVDGAVVGAVHGLEEVLFALFWSGDGTEGVLSVLGVVS